MLNFKNVRSPSAVAQIAATKLTKNLHQSASKISLGATLAVTVVAGAAALAPEMAFAVDVSVCDTPDVDGISLCVGETSESPVDFPGTGNRLVSVNDGDDIIYRIAPDTSVEGSGLAIVAAGSDPVNVDNQGSIIVNAVVAELSVGGNSALYLSSNGGEISYTGDGLILNEGGGNGLGVVSGGGGVVNLTVDGNVNAVNGAAISVVDGASASGAITIATTGEVTGKDGIVVNSATEGAIDISATEDITAGGSEIGDGVRVNATGGAASIDVVVGNVSASKNGIVVDASGATGDITLNVNGDLTTTSIDDTDDFSAIAVNATDAVSEAVIAITITGAGPEDETVPRTLAGAGLIDWNSGISVNNAGLGAITIVADAEIFAREYGVNVVQTNEFNTDGINVAVTGDIEAENAVYVQNYGAATSAIDLTFGGDVTGNGGNAIEVVGQGNLTLTTNGVVSANSVTEQDPDDPLETVVTGGSAISVDLAVGNVTLTTTDVVSAVHGYAAPWSVDNLSFTNNEFAAINILTRDGDITASIGGNVFTDRMLAGAALQTEEGDIDFTLSDDATISGIVVGVGLETRDGGITATFNGDVTAARLNSEDLGEFGAINAAVLAVATDAIDLNLNGNITASGEGSYALVVQGEAAIDVNNTGEIGNTASNTAVEIRSLGEILDADRFDPDFNPDNYVVRFANSGTVRGAVEISTANYAISVDNSNLVIGNIDLSSDGDVSFTNTGNYNIEFVPDTSADAEPGALLPAYYDGELKLIAGAREIEDGAGEISTVYGNITLSNSGTLWTNIYSTQTGGNLDLTNSETGVIDAGVYLSGAQSGGVTNAGTITLWYDDNSVQGDFVNSGTLNFVNEDGYTGTSLEVLNFAVANSSQRASNVSTFTNSGTINMANGDASNMLAIEGNYAGEDGTITMDFARDGSAHDAITIGGNASGNTTVYLTAIDGEDGEDLTKKLLDDNFLNLITVEGETDGDATFDFGGVVGLEFPTTGLVLTNFAANPENGQQFGLVQSLNAASRAMGHIAHITESASAVLDESISPYVTQRKVDGKAVQLGAWGRVGTGTVKQQLGAAVAGFGLETSGVDKVRTKNESLQAGIDLGALNIGGGDWSVNVGVTGGWYEADAAIYGLGQVDVEAEFLGGYAVIGNGKLKLEGQMRREWRDLTVTVADLTATRMVGDSKAWLGNVRASYRLGAEAGVALTPFAEYRFGTSKFDNISVDELASFQQANHKREHVELGAELGYRKFAASGLNFEPFVGAAWLKNDSNRAKGSYTFSEDENEFATVGQAWDKAVRLSWGLKAESATGRYGLFLNGNTIQAKDVKSVGVHVGGRINF